MDHRPSWRIDMKRKSVNLEYTTVYIPKCFTFISQFISFINWRSSSTGLHSDYNANILCLTWSQQRASNELWPATTTNLETHWPNCLRLFSGERVAMWRRLKSGGKDTNKGHNSPCTVVSQLDKTWSGKSPQPMPNKVRNNFTWCFVSSGAHFFICILNSLSSG